MRVLILLLLTLTIAFGCSQNREKQKAFDDLRATTIEYIADLEGGTTLDHLQKHVSKLKLLYGLHEKWLTPDQRLAWLRAKTTAETADEVASFCFSRNHKVVIKAEERLLTLSPESYEFTKKVYGQQAVVSKATTVAAAEAKKFLSTLATPNPAP